MDCVALEDKIHQTKATQLVDSRRLNLFEWENANNTYVVKGTYSNDRAFGSFDNDTHTSKIHVFRRGWLSLLQDKYIILYKVNTRFTKQCRE